MDFLEDELEEILNIFREESEEQLQKLNKNLLKLESNPKDYTAISELFREAHSLKGAARMIGLEDIQSIAHKLEDVFVQAKDGYLEVTSEIVDIMCKAVDCISSIVDESIKTRGNAQVPEIQKVIASLENIIGTKPPSAPKEEVLTQCDIMREFYPSEENSETASSISEKYPLDKIKRLITQVSVNIEKLKVFPFSKDALEEFLFHITNLCKAIQHFESNRLKGLVDDIKFKLETALQGSGILVEDEVSEIEESFNLFIASYERATFNLKRAKELAKNANATQEQQPETQNVIEVKPEIVENSQEVTEIQEEKTPIEVDEVIPSTDVKSEQGAAAEIEEYGNNEDIKFIKANISAFANHNEDNIPKFEETITRLNALTATINEDIIRQILEKITDFLTLSKDREIPVKQEVLDVLEESFDTTVKILMMTNTGKDDPSLILQRVTVLYQMLKMSAPEESQPARQEYDVDMQQDNVAHTEVSEAQVTYSPATRRGEIYSKNPVPDSDISRGGDFKTGDSNTIKTLRVDTQKLDQLVNQAGELIIAKIKAKEHLSDVEKIIRDIEDWHREWNKMKHYFRHADKHNKIADVGLMLNQHAAGKNFKSFLEEHSSKLLNLMTKMNILYKTIQEDDTRLDLIVSGLEEKIKNVRVLPLATIFHLFPRMVRDIARERNKEVEFFITGSETSVDKKIIEEIKAPLMHILRNSIDHGIETPSERIERGKPPSGKILLAAYQLENSVLIQVTDDGKGIDTDAIRRKVLQKGLLTKEELDSMPEEQVMNIIFWPGFSTGEVVTDISGRGIGLDIVYTKIAQLNGNVKVRSNLGKGCQVSIQIPVTMATINSFLVKTNEQTFAIPTNSIKTTLLVDIEQVFYKEGRKTILVDDRTIPICSLAEVLEMPENTENYSKLVVIIIQVEDMQVGFIVDKLIGDQEILHKNLSAPLVRVRNIAGITTLGSGNLCLILNVSDLVKSAYVRFGKNGSNGKSLLANKSVDYM
ncbi:MAG: chemotaxis protein CheA, partial [Candidatus Gastranaerophilales bacterium]|nr:chemotaxis protein CheA [Candidatus Gastranaerophilales bacterium]